MKFSSDQNSNDDLFLNSPSSSTIARGNSVAFRVAAAELAAEKVQHRGVLPPLIRAPDSAQHANRPAPEQKMKNASMPSQIDREAIAQSANRIAPAKPIILAAFKLRIGPTLNQSSPRTIWPPSSG